MNHTLINDTVLIELAIKNALARMQHIAPYLVVAEVVLLFISLVTAAMFGFILWQTKTFHINLRMLFLSLVLATYGYVISRFAIILQVYLHQNLLLFMTMSNSPYALFASIFATMFTFNQIGVVTERIIATFCVKSYENSRRPLIFVMIIIPWIVSIIVSMLLACHIIDFGGYSISLIVCNIITWIFLVTLYTFNRKLYQKKQASTLSEKYQISENIRTLKLLGYFVLMTDARNTLTISIIMIDNYYLAPRLQIFELWLLDMIMRFIIGFYMAFYPFALMYRHKDLLKVFKKKILRMQIHDPTNKVSPQNLFGQPLNATVGVVDYFKGLQHAWDVVLLAKETNNKSIPTQNHRIFDKKQISQPRAQQVINLKRKELKRVATITLME